MGELITIRHLIFFFFFLIESGPGCCGYKKYCSAFARTYKATHAQTERMYWVEATHGQNWKWIAHIANCFAIRCCSLAMISVKTGRFLKRVGVQAWYSHQRCLPPLSTGSTHAKLSSGAGNWKEHEGRRTKENNALIASAVGATCIVGKAKPFNVMRLTTFSPVGSRNSNGMRMCVCECVCVCVCM